ncbi:hypothetical protein AYI70_g9115 [Smittium culicis]|uniref:Chitin-binding type-2 domain-containing protein n=1 Tax=Smittium culicis TaxID=133412 RepID=A0A1R1XCU7_9FUNG|nr:hypothetical protein AYI70_g9115 [Smittium culicis]
MCSKNRMINIYFISLAAIFIFSLNVNGKNHRYDDDAQYEVCGDVNKEGYLKAGKMIQNEDLSCLYRDVNLDSNQDQINLDEFINVEYDTENKVDFDILRVQKKALNLDKIAKKRDLNDSNSTERNQSLDDEDVTASSYFENDDSSNDLGSSENKTIHEDGEINSTQHSSHSDNLESRGVEGNDASNKQDISFEEFPADVSIRDSNESGTDGKPNSDDDTDEKPTSDDDTDEKPTSGEINTDEKPTSGEINTDEKPTSDEIDMDEKPTSDEIDTDEKPTSDGIDTGEKATKDEKSTTDGDTDSHEEDTDEIENDEFSISSSQENGNSRENVNSDSESVEIFDEQIPIHRDEESSESATDGDDGDSDDEQSIKTDSHYDESSADITYCETDDTRSDSGLVNSDENRSADNDDIINGSSEDSLIENSSHNDSDDDKDYENSSDLLNFDDDNDDDDDIGGDKADTDDNVFESNTVEESECDQDEQTSSLENQSSESTIFDSNSDREREKKKCRKNREGINRKLVSSMNVGEQVDSENRFRHSSEFERIVTGTVSKIEDGNSESYPSSDNLGKDDDDHCDSEGYIEDGSSVSSALSLDYMIVENDESRKTDHENGGVLNHDARNTRSFGETGNYSYPDRDCGTFQYDCLDGRPTDFLQCVNGRFMVRQCAPGTVCKTLIPGYIYCGWP